MPYLMNVSQEQVSRGPSSGIVLVKWTFGNLIPDVIEIRQEGALLASATIDTGTRTPTSQEIVVPAPSFLSLVVSPRTVEGNTLTDKMQDDWGELQYWDSFSVQLPSLTVAAEPTPPPAPRIPPTILRVDKSEGEFTVHWQSPGVDHFNVTLVPSIVPFQGQIELAGSHRSFRQDRVIGGRSYRFSIQGCTLAVFGIHSNCSDWVGTDIWMPPELGYQAWRRWFPIRPETVFNQTTPVCAVARMPEHVDLFKIGFDGAVWSSWWHGEGDPEGWRPWFRIHPQTVFAQEAPVTALARRSDHLDLFTTGFDGAVWSSWWNGDGGGWRPWFPIHPQTVFRQDRPVVAVAREPEHVDLFRVGFDGAVWSSWWHADAHGWRPWFQIHPETVFPVEARVTALARRPDHLDLFVIGHDGAVWSSWWHADAEGWRPWFQIHPQTVFRHDQEIAAVAREPEHVDLFTVGNDGAVWSSWWHGDGGGWRPWFQIHPQTRFALTSRVTAIARRPDHVDLFITGLDGAVWSSWWHADAQGWRPWFPIHPATVFDQNHPVTAISRLTEHIDLFKVGLDGAVWSAWWAP
ncbi:MAG: hypothetical protein ACRD21_10280 [Vicinamibacteria bacterium]